jgi:RNA recognition motif-containing protein
LCTCSTPTSDGLKSRLTHIPPHSETTSIPTNPRTTRPVGYAFVDVSTSSEADRAIQELNGQSILDRKVSVQLARKPEPAAEVTEGGEGAPRRRQSTRGRGRGRGGRAARSGRGKKGQAAEGTVEGEDATNGTPTNVPGQAAPLTETTNEALTATTGEDGITVDGKANANRPRKQRGPPEDGVPSKTKIMVANLPYDLREEKVCPHSCPHDNNTMLTHMSSSSRSSPSTSRPPPRLLSVPSPNS